MKTLFCCSLLALTLVAPAARADGQCSKPSAENAAEAPSQPAAEKAPESTSQPAAELPTMTAEQVKEALAKGEVTPVDVNGADTRSEYGMVPGALLLGDDGSTVATLGEDKARALVFYCGSERCGAAPRAAAAAVELGYTNVSVMKVGIRGWAAAGFDVTKPATN